MGRFSALPTAAITDDSAVGGQIIQGSLIFDDDHNTFFHRDMVGGNRRTWTISYWTKLLDVNSTSAQRFWSAGDSGSGDVLKAEYYSGSSTRQIGFIDNNHSGSGIRFTTDAHLQDNAWYHIVMAVDTTLSTAADRVKIYINGEKQTLWSSGSEHNHPPNQNYETAMNKASTGLAFGRAYSFGAGSATHFEGQMAELYLVDGAQLEVTEFGYTESQTGIWRPKKYQTPSVDNHFNWALNNNIIDTLNGTTFSENGGSSSFVSAGSNSFGLTNCLDISGGKYLSYAITPASQWTIDFYVKLDNFTGANSYIGGWNGTNGNDCCVGVNKDNAPNYYFVVWGGGGNLYQTSVTVSLNTWYHIRMTTNATNDLKLYVNGTLVATDTSSNEEPATPLTFGDMQSGRFDGQIAGVRYITRDLGAPPAGGLVSTNGVLPNVDQILKFGKNGFYYPLDGSHHITKDLSGNGNDSNPYNLRGTVPLHMATGGLPILNTNKGGTVARPGVRPDPFASNIVLALPLSNRYQAIGTDVHHLIKGSGSPKSLSNSGTILGYFYSNFYGSSGSAYVANASSQQINISTSDDFNFGTGDFTVECWIYPAVSSAADGSIFVTHNGSTYFAFNFDPGDRFNIYLNSGSPAWSPVTPENLIEYTKWNHVALVKHSNVVKLYVNGLAVGSYSHSGQVGYAGASTTICRIGGGGSNSLNCYMQDMRIYKGVAKYTDTFTCASTDSSVIPDSPSGIAVSRKFRPSLSGSVGFDGTSDKITANSTDFVFGTDDFTIEATVFKTDTSYNGSDRAFIFGQTDNNAGGRNGVAFGYQSGGLWLLQGNGSSWVVETTVDVFPLNQWVHVAVSKNSGTTKYFVNGKLVYTFNTNVNLGADNNGDISIGSINSTSMDWDGHISNFRIIKGTGLYTSSFTPPTEPLTNVTNTKLLCCQDKYSVTAKAVGPTLTGVGNVYTSDFSPFNDDTISRASSYAYLNRLRARRAGVVAEGSLFLHGSNYALQFATAIFGPGYITTGKYIWEIENSGGQGDSTMYLGINSVFDQGAGEIYSQANKTNLSCLYYKPFQDTGSQTRTNQKEGVTTFLLDVDNQILRGYYNTKLIFTDTGIPNASTTSYAPFAFSTNDGVSGALWSDAHFNFGQRPFVFTPPEGYETISSTNIEPSSILNPKKHFDTIVYTGDGASVREVTGLEFQPDMVWVKSRSQSSTNHGLTDSVKTDPSYPTNHTMLYPNLTNAETGGGNYFAMTTSSGRDPFLPDGFLLNNNTSGNNNGSTYVAWCWKAGGGTSSSNPFMIDGKPYATAAAAGLNGGTANPTGASVNTKAGFSIISYTATNNQNVSYSHGLNQAPEIIIAKDRDNTRAWGVYYSVNGTNTNWMELNNSNAQGSNNSGTTPVGGFSGSYMTLHQDYFAPAYSAFANGGNDGSSKMIAYMWHSVPGYSKIGSYYGNGQTDGKFVYTGFKPAFVLLKRSTDATNYWEIRDNKRVTNNPNNERLFPNTGDSQSVGEGIDFFNNGFKLRNSGSGSNSNDKVYIYMAFAEQPLTTQYGTQSNGE